MAFHDRPKLNLNNSGDLGVTAQANYFGKRVKHFTLRESDLVTLSLSPCRRNQILAKVQGGAQGGNGVDKGRA